MVVHKHSMQTVGNAQKSRWNWNLQKVFYQIKN